MKTPEETLRWERVASRPGRMERMIDLDIHEQRRETLRRRALERLRSRRAYPLPGLRLSELPEGLSPLRGGLRVRFVASPIQASMSFERICAGCRERRVRPGPQPCERCGEVTETLWRWMESLEELKGSGGFFLHMASLGPGGIARTPRVAYSHSPEILPSSAYSRLVTPGWWGEDRGGGSEGSDCTAEGP